MMGMSLGPATGKIVNDLVLGKKPDVDITLFRPERYA